jgi:hypothetical protein
MEAYSVYGLRVWLADRNKYLISDRARDFAKWSSLGSLVLGILGQVTFHLLEVGDSLSTPGWVTALVACLPVGVLGLGAALSHLLRDDVDSGQDNESLENGRDKIVTSDSSSGSVLNGQTTLDNFTALAPSSVKELSTYSNGSTNGLTPRKFILSEWKEGRCVTSPQLYELFPDRKKESLRSILSIARRDNPGLEPVKSVN